MADFINLTRIICLKIGMKYIILDQKMTEYGDTNNDVCVAYNIAMSVWMNADKFNYVKYETMKHQFFSSLA